MRFGSWTSALIGVSVGFMAWKCMPLAIGALGYIAAQIFRYVEVRMALVNDGK